MHSIRIFARRLHLRTPLRFAPSRGMSNGNHVLDVLKRRGFVADVTNPDELQKFLATPRTVYCGFDPTAESLHAGNLIMLMALAHFQRCGHKPIALLGGATGMIDEVETNIKGLSSNLDRFFSAVAEHERAQSPTAAPLAAATESKATVMNNLDWYRDMNLIAFLRDVGKHFRMNTMLAKDSVQSRLTRPHTDAQSVQAQAQPQAQVQPQAQAQADAGMSFTEFSYQTLQAYDFLNLFRSHACTVQIGGSDQWGNIVGGIDLIRRTQAKAAFGLTVPLLTTAKGEKFGKSAGNAVWLDPAKTSPFHFYQFFLNTADADVRRLMLLFTFMPEADVDRVVAARPADDPRYAARVLAEEATRLCHGESGLQAAQQGTQAAFGAGAVANLTGMSRDQAIASLTGVTRVEVSRAALVNVPLVHFVVACKAAESNREARDLIMGGGVNLNDQRMTDPKYTVSAKDLLGEGSFCLLRIGKRTPMLVLVQD